MSRFEKIFVCVLIIVSIISVYGLYIEGSKSIIASDSYIRDRVVMLIGKHGSCSGIQVKAPSGTVYTLSAAHCSILIDNGKVIVMSEDGNKSFVNFIAIDEEHDLMLLSSANSKSIQVADSFGKHEQAHSMTHGRGMPSYRTDGEMLQQMSVEVTKFGIFSKEDRDLCNITSYQRPVDTYFYGEYCVITLNLEISTVAVVPGSSGGAIVNNKGQLIGIVSSTFGDSIFSGLVPLHDIQSFLEIR